MTNLWNAVRSRRVLVIAVGVSLAVALGTSAAIFGPELFAPDQAAKAANATNQENQANEAKPAAKAKPAGFSDFRSEEAGFELSYPSTWHRETVREPQEVPLLLTQGTEESFQVRVKELPLQEPIGADQIPAIRQLTDQQIANIPSVQMVVEPKQIELGGLPGLYYFYYFTDTTTGQEGAHSHYFLFNDKTMISMIFQTLPKERFAESAKTFDDITSTFRALK